MEESSEDNSPQNDQFFGVAETPGCENLDVADAGGGCQGAGSEGESKPSSTSEFDTDSSGIAGGATIHDKEKPCFSEGETSEDRRADLEEGEHVASIPRSNSRSSVEKPKSTRITLSEEPEILGEGISNSVAAEEEGAQKSCVPTKDSPSKERSTKRADAERLRFRSTLATFINDDKGIYGEWRAKELAATVAAKEFLQVLACRVENLLNEATAVTGRLFSRKNTLREEELQRRASSKKISSSLFSLSQRDNGCAKETGEDGIEKEHGSGNPSEQKDGVEAQQFQREAAAENDTGSVKRVAAELMDNLLKVAIRHKSEMLQNHTQEDGGEEDSAEYRAPSGEKTPVSEEESNQCYEKQMTVTEKEEESNQCYEKQMTITEKEEESNQCYEKRMTVTEKGRFSFEEPHPTIVSHSSRASLESYNAGNFPEDFLTYQKQASEALTAKIEKEAEESSCCEPNACESTQVKRDKLWKIFGRETQAGRLLYQLYKPAEPGGDIVYPVPKSIKDLRGNPNFRVLAHESSSSRAAAAGRHQKRNQVKVAVPRVGRHAARAAAAAGGGSCSKKFEKGNFLSGRGPQGKRSIRQIAKETEKRRQQILEEASSRGVTAAAMGLKRDREKARMLEKLPYTLCSLLPEAARLPPLSAKDRAVFFAEKAAADRDSLYSAGSASPSPRARKSSDNTNSNAGRSRRSCSASTCEFSRTTPRAAKTSSYCCSSKLEKSIGRAIIDPCTQTLIPYVAAARQRYKKQGLVDAETGMTEEQKHLFVQTLKEIQLRKEKLENLQKALPDHVLEASLFPAGDNMCAKNRAAGSNGNVISGRPCSSSRRTSRPQSGADAARKGTNLFSACFSSNVAKSRLAQRTILQQLQDETRLKREIGERMKELETLISISDAQQLDLKRN